METLGSTDVICTDKTGTLTENRMRPTAVWTPSTEVTLTGEDAALPAQGSHDAALRALADTAATCNNARLDGDEGDTGDPTEVAVLSAARALGADVDPERRERERRHLYNLDPELKLMSTLDADDGPNARWLHTKGAPEAVLARCTDALSAAGELAPLGHDERERVMKQVERYAREGLRVLALARRAMPATVGATPARADAERELCLLGLVTMLDPPRAEVIEAVARCHSAGIRIIVITGDHPLTAAAIAGQVGSGESARGRSTLAASTTLTSASCASCWPVPASWCLPGPRRRPSCRSLGRCAGPATWSR